MDVVAVDAGMGLARAHTHVSQAQEMLAEMHSQFVFLLLMPGIGPLIRDCVCLMAFFACLAGFYKAGYFDMCLNPKCWDYRRLPCCGSWIKKQLLENEYDPFPAFGCHVFVHSVKDIKNTALVGKAQLHAVVSFWYATFQTKPTKEGRWEESSKLSIPQGATECVVTVYSKGTMKTEVVGSATFNILLEIKDEPKAKEKRWYKLTKDRETKGQIALTFRDIELDAYGRDTQPPMLEGLEDVTNSQFVEKIRELVPAGQTNIGGRRRLEILSKVNRGTLHRLGGGLGGPKKLYFAAMNIPPPGGSGKPKWLWCWYEDEAAFKRSPNEPQGFFALIKVTSVNRNLKKPNQWMIGFQDSEKQKQTLEMKLDDNPDRDVEAWVDGFEFHMHIVKEDKLNEKAGNVAAQEVQDAWPEMSTNEKWEYWEATYRKQGMPEDQIAAKKKQFVQMQKDAGGGGGGKSKGKGKGAAAKAKPDAAGKSKGGKGKGKK